MQHANQTPPILVYPSSFDGWLTAVFIAYEKKLASDPELQLIDQACYQPSLIQSAEYITINPNKAERVLQKLGQIIGNHGIRQLLWGFLSEHEQVGNILFQVVKYALTQSKQTCPTTVCDILHDFSNQQVLALSKLVKSVGREKHRMEAFVRFEHTIHDIYFARIEPDFNVLPLISEYFYQRYQDQNWAIFDISRHYGIYYKKPQSKQDSLAPIQLISDIEETAIKNPASLHSELEQNYQQLWQGYFANINIKNRSNPRLHKQQMPQRYWKYLTEKHSRADAPHLSKSRYR